MRASSSQSSRTPTISCWDSDEEVWNGHVKYILGKTVCGMETKNAQCVVVQTPCWELVLHYNQMLFNRIAELMNEGDKVTGGISPPLTLKITGTKFEFYRSFEISQGGPHPGAMLIR